jgi:hypothetical protein
MHGKNNISFAAHGGVAVQGGDGPSDICHGLLSS